MLGQLLGKYKRRLLKSKSFFCFMNQALGTTKLPRVPVSVDLHAMAGSGPVERRLVMHRLSLTSTKRESVCTLQATSGRPGIEANRCERSSGKLEFF